MDSIPRLRSDTVANPQAGVAGHHVTWLASAAATALAARLRAAQPAWAAVSRRAVPGGLVSAPGLAADR
jgi:hypothetical protein